MNAVHALRESGSPASASVQSSLRECVSYAVRRYLRDLGDHPAEDLHALVLHEVEAPLFAEVLLHCDGNQSRAAALYRHPTAARAAQEAAPAIQPR